MSLLHPALLFGLGLALIPVLLHLMLRAKPKRLIFPALRLLQQNRRQNVRRMQLRHLWLLLLRMLVIALIVLAVTRPSLPAANYSLVLSEWLTLLTLVGVALGSYFAVVRWWTRFNWPRNQLLTRRTMLRGGIGVATAILLLLGVGWPYARRVSAEIKDPAPKGGENLPAAAVFLFDTSPSMHYRQGNQNRLQAAQQIARDHLSRLPAGSKVAVATSQETASGAADGKGDAGPEHIPAFSLDLQAARSRIDACTIQSGGLNLNDRVRTALLAQEEDRRRITAEQSSVPEEKRQDRYVREIYLFTDLARTAWREDVSAVLKEELARVKNVSLYLIDVGEPNPQNIGIISVKPARDTAPQNSAVKIDVALTSTGGTKPDQTVEFFVNRDGKSIKSGQQTITVEAGAESRLTFEIPSVVSPFQQGEFRLVGADPLAIDDVGYFTVRTLPPLKVAVVTDRQATAFYWQSAIDYVSTANITRYETEFLTSNQLRDADLKRFDVVYLINDFGPSDVTWQKLHDFVNAGGGLGIILGASSSVLNPDSSSTRINPLAYESQVAQTILPAKLVASLSATKSVSMDLRNTQHPFLRRLDDAGALSELGAVEIFRTWKVEPLEGALVVARYDGPQGHPALIERRVGKGRVMELTTSVDDQKWNDFVGSALSFVFADQLTQYLSQQASLRSNLHVGDEVVLPLDRNGKLKKTVLRMPDFKQKPIDIPANSPSILLRDLTAVGSYQVDSVPGEIDYHTGFSLNVTAAESDLRRLEKTDLDGLFGEGHYALSRDPSTLEINVQAGRIGQEMYSAVVGILVVVFALEQFTAAWFYRTDEA